MVKAVALACLLQACLLGSALAGRQTLQAAPEPVPVVAPEAVPVVAPGAVPVPAVPLPAGEGEFFVEVRDGKFVAGCHPFRVAGWNQWEVLEAAAGAPALSGASIPSNMTGPQMVRMLLDRGAKNGLNTVRIWAYAVNPQYALQTKPGEYNEAAFRGLDFFLDEARKRNIKVILALTGNWNPTGGIPEYLKWAGKEDHVDFFTDPEVKALYKDFLKTIATRKNTINGRVYADDPTILGWNLGNELRCQGCPKGTIANWADEMATYMKSPEIDPNHLVTLGEDGFYGDKANPANPGVVAEYPSDWASNEGQDFIADHSSPAIDFATFHAWIDNWNDVSDDFLKRWIESHVSDSAKILKKPVVLEEWGKWVNVTAGSTMADRDHAFQVGYDTMAPLIESGDLAGSLFWQWYLQGQEAPASEGGGLGLFGIDDDDTTFPLIQENTDLVNKINAEPLPDCSVAVHKAAPMPPVPDCAQHRVAGLLGTGTEGVECDVPINECVRGTDDCDGNAACVDTELGFECKCYWGFDGDGRTCKPNKKAMAELMDVFWFEEEGLGCSPGKDVEWPAAAPGYVYDPLNSFAFWNSSGGGKFGSRRNVTLEQCMTACQMSDTCESFVHNDVLMQCFLKNGQCPLYNMCWDPKEVICYSDNDRGGKFEFGCGYWRTYYRKDMDVKAACAAYKDKDGRKPTLENAKPFEEFVAKNGLAGARINPAAEPAEPPKAPAEPPKEPAEPPKEPTGPVVQQASGLSS